MAELHIERKKNVWPWLIALIVLLVLIWAMFELMDRSPADAPAMPPAVTEQATTATANPAAATDDDDATTTPPP